MTSTIGTESTVNITAPRHTATAENVVTELAVTRVRHGQQDEWIIIVVDVMIMR